MRWDAARAASQRPTRKYKPVGPVGEATPLAIISCRGCGYHQCSCPKLEPCGLNSVTRGRTLENPHHIDHAGYAFALNPQREERVAAKRFELPPLAADTYEAFKDFVPKDREAAKHLLLTGEWPEELL